MCSIVEGEGTVRVERIALAHQRGRSTESRVYSVAVLEVPLPLAVHIERAGSEDNSTSSHRDDSPHGLSRLLCESQLFESFVAPNYVQHQHTSAGAEHQRNMKAELNSDTRTPPVRSANGKRTPAPDPIPHWLAPPAPPAYLAPLDYVCVTCSLCAHVISSDPLCWCWSVQYNEESVHPLYHLMSTLLYDHSLPLRPESVATN